MEQPTETEPGSAAPPVSPAPPQAPTPQSASPKRGKPAPSPDASKPVPRYRVTNPQGFFYVKLYRQGEIVAYPGRPGRGLKRIED